MFGSYSALPLSLLTAIHILSIARLSRCFVNCVVYLLHLMTQSKTQKRRMWIKKGGSTLIHMWSLRKNPSLKVLLGEKHFEPPAYERKNATEMLLRCFVVKQCVEKSPVKLQQAFNEWQLGDGCFVITWQSNPHIFLISSSASVKARCVTGRTESPSACVLAFVSLHASLNVKLSTTLGVFLVQL